MRPRSRCRSAVAWMACALLISACGRDDATSSQSQNAVKQPGLTGTPAATNPAPPGGEIPADQLGAVMAAHLRGVGLMEQFKYSEAAKAFREVHAKAPNWIPGSINLAIALINDTGKQAAEQEKKPGTSALSNYDEALALLNDVLARDAENPHARYSRGIILYQQGEIARAHEDFVAVSKKDPNDASTWLWVGTTLSDPDRPGFQGSGQAKALIETYKKALACNPYLVPAFYKLSSAYRLARDPKAAGETMQLWQQLNSEAKITATGDAGRLVYSEMGRYADVIDPLSPSSSGKPAACSNARPRFDPPAPLKIQLPSGHRWVKESDFQGPLAVVGRARARFGAGVATFDADGDGKLDVYLTAAVHGPDGVRDALLINKGDGSFEDATLALGLPKDRASLGVAAGDFDADRRIDLFLTGVGGNVLLRNTGPKGFADVTKEAGVTGPAAISLAARWLDIDQDGDLDLYVVNYTAAENADTAFTDKVPPGLPNAAYRNDGKPKPVGGSSEDNWAPAAVSLNKETDSGLSLALTPWPDAEALLGGKAAHTALAALDIDGDRDLDLVVSNDTEKGSTFTAILNDRIGRFHSAELKDLAAPEPTSGLLTADLDKDGLADLVALGPKGKVNPWRNRTRRTSEGTTFAWNLEPTNAQHWRAAVVADLDLDGAWDLVGLPAIETGRDGTPAAVALSWARNEEVRLNEWRLQAQPLALGPEPKPLQGFALADLAGNPLPDFLLIQDGEGPALARNLGNGNHWVAIELGGRWKAGKKDLMRTNPHGIGTRIWLEGQGLFIPFDLTTPESGLAQSLGPIVFGVCSNESVPLLRLRWPDSVVQCEMNVATDRVHAVAENNRKPDSCPVLFTWDGTRFVCLGDFLGGGGLGYLIAPGVYNEPDRDEAMAIAPDQLRPVDGTYRVAIVEPMDEATYLDHVTLDVVDRPPGVSVAPDERFAPSGPRPSGRLLAWKTTVEPVRATDLKGKDITDVLRAWDRRTADDFKLRPNWTGYAEEHGIVLDFGDRLAKYGTDVPLVLCLAGWVEYPHSATNYAAATAGVTLNPPVLERRREDGTWEVLDPHPGYPAGMPRLSTLILTGKLAGGRCVLRLRTNMECYWDQTFVAVADAEAGVKVTTLPVARAELGYRGYLREVSPDGKRPLLYDYDYADPAVLVRLAGRMTRYGDVAPLLRGDDDQLCVFGSGDEVRLEFDARRAPPLSQGWTRSYVLRAVGYCKDADLGTAASDTVDPLPWKGMGAYPFGHEGKRPEDLAYRAYLREYQTRKVGD